MRLTLFRVTYRPHYFHYSRIAPASRAISLPSQKALALPPEFAARGINRLKCSWNVISAFTPRRGVSDVPRDADNVPVRRTDCDMMRNFNN